MGVVFVRGSGVRFPGSYRISFEESELIGNTGAGLRDKASALIFILPAL